MICKCQWEGGGVFSMLTYLPNYSRPDLQLFYMLYFQIQHLHMCTKQAISLAVWNLNGVECGAGTDIRERTGSEQIQPPQSSSCSTLYWALPILCPTISFTGFL